MSHFKKTFWNKNFKLRIFCQLIFSPWELRNDCQVSILVQETLSPAGRTSGLHRSVVLAVRRLWMTLTRAISEEWRGQKLVRVELKSEDRVFEMWTSIYWMSQGIPCSVQSLSRVRLCEPMDCSTPGFPVHHQLSEFAQIHIHWVGDTIQLSHPLMPPSPPVLNLSPHQGLFQWAGSSHQVAKVLELQYLLYLVAI